MWPAVRAISPYWRIARIWQMWHRLPQTKDRFSDLMIQMKEMGFELADVMNVIGQQPVAYDCVFLQKDDTRLRAL
jgi:hypothetical protein